ncbi:hypothetical protein PIROE2DRAFT_11272 [Piromyces sp. E2]|nr:hypothetical protein PIROE2DRAFT_11272 [Piromyces sp. E2]|eukprot:OUM62422.1 hypothetical protein PIROE2DRAFT_11272 [Piromyces sp. E2]
MVNKILINLSTYINSDDLACKLQFYFDRDVNALEYILNNVNNNDKINDIQNTNELPNNSNNNLQDCKYFNSKNIKQSNNNCISLYQISKNYKEKYLNENELEKIINDFSIDKNLYFHDITIKCCVIGLLIYKGVSKVYDPTYFDKNDKVIFYFNLWNDNPVEQRFTANSKVANDI